MKDTETIRSKALVLLQLLIPVITWSVVYVTADTNYFPFISLYTSRVPREEVSLPSFDVVNCLLKTCKLLSTHPFKPFPRRFSGPYSVCSD